MIIGRGLSGSRLFSDTTPASARRAPDPDPFSSVVCLVPVILSPPCDVCHCLQKQSIKQSSQSLSALSSFSCSGIWISSFSSLRNKTGKMNIVWIKINCIFREDSSNYLTLLDQTKKILIPLALVSFGFFYSKLKTLQTIGLRPDRRVENQ